MGEIDAGAEHAASLVFGMLDHGAAHDGDLGRAIEQCEIDAELRTIERGLVLRIEKARIVLRHHRRLADTLHRRAIELDLAVALELRQQRLGVGARQQHGVAEMAAASLLPSTADRNRPWSISRPSLSRCSAPSSAAISCAV